MTTPCNGSWGQSTSVNPVVEKLVAPPGMIPAAGGRAIRRACELGGPPPGDTRSFGMVRHPASASRSGLEEGPYCDLEALVKHVEFRHGSMTSVRLGMSLLFALSLALRRVGRTGLLLAEVAEVLPCSVEDAYTRFPTEAHRCNLRARSGRLSRRTVTCIVVQIVRPAPEFSFLVPGNLGFMHQFSLERGTP
jgi:hypothetical protein